MDVALEGQSPQDRARRYLAKAEEVRRMASEVHDPQIRDSLSRIVADWEFLAAYALNRRI